MNEFAENVWTVEGPCVDFYGCPYPTRMVVVHLQQSHEGDTNNGCAWIWSPVSLSDELAREVEEKAGPVKFIVSPNKIHHIFLKMWAERFPNATVYASPGLEKRGGGVADGVKFNARFGKDEPKPPFSDEIDSVIVSGSYLMDEVEFYHRASKTAIICDFIQRFPEESVTGWKGMLMKLNGVTGEDGSTPREWRFSFWPFGKDELKRCRDSMFAWNAERMIVAHGTCVKSDATKVMKRALAWI
ncbi:hypothetical protein HJC23_011675 [Cyclotella cryptica]|uniref:DUF4336 domain-containing protein n=1 Tax=Cyclotella cryptica TaxID=29204 RepID=A0ABD3QIX7_9STRA|eukprot:CCRYP_004771-RA/>CCRYP_004771-RA protein AED:0.37 eAED:0.37 QI:0/-1/0/1/-1/1/1/0/242